MTQWGIDTLFNPGKRHMDEEKRRLQSTREEVGDSSGGRRIDLEGGKVRLTGRPGKDSEDDSPAEGSLAGDSPAADSTAEDRTPETRQTETEAEVDDTPAGRARRRRRAAG